MFNRNLVVHIVICSFLIFCSCDGEDHNSQKINIKQGPSIRTSSSRELKQLFFVGKYGNRAGVYKYDFSSNSYKIFWGTNQETVINLSYSDDLENIFFLTARRIGMNRGVSSIRDIKLYKIDPDNVSTELITKIGDAVQLYSYWSGINYRIQFTRFDLKYASHIIKFNQIYSQFGKLLKEEKEGFNFIEDSYPDFYMPHQPLISPSGNFGIKHLQDSLYLYVAGNLSKIPVDSSKNMIFKVGWSEEEGFVFISIAGKPTENEYSTIYIFDIINKKVLQKFVSTSMINFYVTKDVLFFDSTNAGQTTIEIFNYRKNESVGNIKLWGGCGLQYISDY